LKPCPDNILGEFVLEGVTDARTCAVQDPVTIYTVGHHKFLAKKAVLFHGQGFRTHEPCVDVDFHSVITGVETAYDDCLLLAKTVRDIALREARRQKPRGDEIGKAKLARRVADRFNCETDESLKEQTNDLQTDLFARWRETGMYGEETLLRSSEEMMRITSRVREGEELAGSVPIEAYEPGPGLTLHIHESLLNHMADQWGFAGRTMTEAEVRTELEAYFTTLLGREVAFEDEAPGDDGPDTFAFDPTDPVRFQIENGAVLMIIRAAFLREGQEDIPPQQVTVPLIPILDGDDILIRRGTVQVAPVEPAENRAEQIARAGIVRKKIEDSILERREPRTYEIEREEREPVEVYVTEIKAYNGWLTIFAE
ncbi:MAG: hypothetical protein ACREJB_11405, partial [Planctomycetaceae bacterium]